MTPPPPLSHQGRRVARTAKPWLPPPVCVPVRSYDSSPRKNRLGSAAMRSQPTDTDSHVGAALAAPPRLVLLDGDLALHPGVHGAEEVERRPRRRAHLDGDALVPARLLDRHAVAGDVEPR